MFILNFTASQLVAHGFGDYVLQSHWMAIEKKKSLWVALVHAAVYSIPFLLAVDIGLKAWLVIVISHCLMDRYSLARFVVFAAGFISPKKYWSKWENCSKTGHNPNTPDWLAGWLLIFVDNTVHIVINALAIQYL